MTTAIQTGEQIILLQRTDSARNADGSFRKTNAVVPVTPDGNGLPAFAPGTTSETLGGEDVVVTKPTLYLPTGTPVTAIDAVLIAGTIDGSANVLTGELYEVDGQPNTWVSPFSGWAPGVAVPLKRITG